MTILIAYLISITAEYSNVINFSFLLYERKQIILTLITNILSQTRRSTANGRRGGATREFRMCDSVL